MKQHLVIPLLFVSLFLSAQEKGVTPKPSTVHRLPSTVRAVVVGISDYQDERIPDLSYAHKDAQAFADWLQSPAGGRVPADQITLLLNEAATGASVAAAIGGLLEDCNQGDQVVIYFSGHGDVEKQAYNQPGFLLCWDSRSNLYMGGGTYSLYFLESMVKALSIDKMAKVLVVADACRSGKLAGQSINGAQITADNLQRQYEHEIKILSCQPNEFSIEGAQWGGGHGAFSFHLLEGLTGLADANQDLQVNLMEIGRYLEDHVSREVAPNSQVPVIVGSRTETVAMVDQTALQALKDKKRNAGVMFSGFSDKSNWQAFIEAQDSSVQSLYVAFEQALKEKRLLEPLGNCADHYYKLLMADVSLDAFRHRITRQYAVALQDDAQQSINAILNANTEQFQSTRAELYEAYKDFPRLLRRAAEILGEEHYMYKLLKAREYLFEGFLRYCEYKASKNLTLEQGEEIVALYQQSLELEPEFPLTHLFMSKCYIYFHKDLEKAIECEERAVALAGSWISPYVYLAADLSRRLKQFDKAKTYLDQAMAIDSLHAFVWKGWTIWYTYQGKIPEAIEAGQKATELDPNDLYTWLNLAKLMQSRQAGYQFGKAEQVFMKCLELDPDHALAHFELGNNYYRSKQYENAEKYYLRAIELDPESEDYRVSLADFYIGFERYEEAEEQYVHIIQQHANPNADTWFVLAQLSTLNERPEDGLKYLEKALQRGLKDRKQIEEDEDLASLRALPGYEPLMRMYFKEE